jgi:hypothetical protein
MVRWYLICAVFFAVVTTARAAEPPHFTYSPQPPGTIVQSQLVYLAGEGMQSQWRGVLSKQLVGTSAGMKFYQWYLSIYAINGTTYQLKYRSPRRPVPFDALQHASDASMWFPQQSGSVVGAADFRNDASQELVVASQQIGADCGTARIDVFTANPRSGNVKTAVSLQNYCTLKARIVQTKSGAALQLTGPYYGTNAATCCPTKTNAVATLRYRNGAWVESPRYFKIVAQ